VKKEKFLELSKAIAEKVKYSSNPNDALETPEYKQLRTTGIVVVGWALEEMKKNPEWFYFSLIDDVTGEGPQIPLESQGKLYEIIDIFQEWGKRKHFI
jgi:hypothetical protein